MSVRTLAYLDCTKCGSVLANKGVCPTCGVQLYQLKPLKEDHVLNGRRRRHNNKCRGVDRL